MRMRVYASLAQDPGGARRGSSVAAHICGLSQPIKEPLHEALV